MKNLIFSLVSILLLTACEEENPQPVSQIDPALATYVSTFYSEAEERGVTLSGSLIAELSVNIQGVSAGRQKDGQYYLYVSETIFNELNRLGMHEKIEALVAYRMATIFVNAPEPKLIDTTRVIELFPDYERESAFNEWF